MLGEEEEGGEFMGLKLVCDGLTIIDLAVTPKQGSVCICHKAPGNFFSWEFTSKWAPVPP